MLRLRGAGDKLEEGDVADGASTDAVRCRNADTLARLNLFPNDANLLFDEANHRYTIFGTVPEHSCTSLISTSFADFQPDSIINMYFERWSRDPASKYYTVIQSVLEAGGSAADAAARISDEWAEAGAAAIGTASTSSTARPSRRHPGSRQRWRVIMRGGAAPSWSSTSSGVSVRS